MKTYKVIHEDHDPEFHQPPPTFKSKEEAVAAIRRWDEYCPGHMLFEIDDETGESKRIEIKNTKEAE